MLLVSQTNLILFAVNLGFIIVNWWWNLRARQLVTALKAATARNRRAEQAWLAENSSAHPRPAPSLPVKKGG